MSYYSIVAVTALHLTFSIRSRRRRWGPKHLFCHLRSSRRKKLLKCGPIIDLWAHDIDDWSFTFRGAGYWCLSILIFVISLTSIVHTHTLLSLTESVKIPISDYFKLFHRVLVALPCMRGRELYHGFPANVFLFLPAMKPLRLQVLGFCLPKFFWSNLPSDSSSGQKNLTFVIDLWGECRDEKTVLSDLDCLIH